MAVFNRGQPTVTIEGDEELIRTLNRMSKGFRSKALLHAVTQGGEIVRREASARAPVGRTGALRDSIRVVRLKETSKLAKVAVSWTTWRAGKRDAFYGLFIEKGTKPRHKKRRVSVGFDKRGRRRKNLAVGEAGSTGTGPRRPFLIPAYESKREAVSREIKAQLSRMIREEVKKGL